MFKQEKVSVIGAATGKEDLLLVQSEKPDIILFDIVLLGDMDVSYNLIQPRGLRGRIEPSKIKLKLTGLFKSRLLVSQFGSPD